MRTTQAGQATFAKGYAGYNQMLARETRAGSQQLRYPLLGGPAGIVTSVDAAVHQGIVDRATATDAARETPETLAGTQEQLRATRSLLTTASNSLVAEQAASDAARKQVRTYQITTGVAAVAFLGTLVYALRR